MRDRLEHRAGTLAGTRRRPAGSDVVGHLGVAGRSAAAARASQYGLGRKRMSATKSASTGMPYLKPKQTTVDLQAGSSSAVPNALARSGPVSWWTLRLEVSMTRSASPRRSREHRRARGAIPSSSRPPPCSGCGRRAASWRRTSTSSVASRKSRVVRPAGDAAGPGWPCRRVEERARSGRRPPPRSAARCRGSRRPAAPRRAAAAAAGCRRRTSRGPPAPWPPCCGRRRSCR